MKGKNKRVAFASLRTFTYIRATALFVNQDLSGKIKGAKAVRAKGIKFDPRFPKVKVLLYRVVSHGSKLKSIRFFPRRVFTVWYAVFSRVDRNRSDITKTGLPCNDLQFYRCGTG